MKIRKILIWLSLIAVFSLTACHVGLGESVDLIAPSMTISSPVMFENVPDKFTVVGECSDNLAISTINATVKGESFSKSYKYENKKWYNEDGTVFEGGTATGDEKNLKWSLDLKVLNGTSGAEYTVSAEVTDAFGNKGKTSKEEVVFYIDIEQPIVSVISPSLFETAELASALTVGDLNNFDKISYFQNNSFTLKGSQKEDAGLAKLDIYIDKSESMEVPEYPTEIQNSVWKTTLNSDLRNWECKIDLSTQDEFKTGIHVLRVISDSFDIAGNIERKILGWFVYCQAADIPWVSVDFGKVVNEQIPAGSVLRGGAYDDDGVSSVTVNFFKKNPEPPYNYDIELTTLNKTFNAEGVSNYSWNVPAPPFACDFIVKVSCTDINGVTSPAVSKTMQVLQSESPVISVSTTNSLVSDNILDNINSEGKIVINTDVYNGDDIKKVSLIYIKNGNENSIANYHKDESQWESITGNKVWVLYDYNEDQALPVGNRKQVYDSVNQYNKVNISKDLYLFNNNDDGLEFRNNFSTTSGLLSGLTLVVVAENKSGAFSYKDFYLKGDSSYPEISIKSFKAGENRTYNISEEIPTLKPLKNGNTTVVVEGTLIENSLSVLNNGCRVLLNGHETTITKNNGVYNWSCTFTDASNPEFITLDAEIEDLAGNKATDTYSFFFDNEDPKLTGYNSDVEGTYGVGSVISFYMEFNKNVKLESGSAPELTMSTGGTAVYDSSKNNSSGAVKQYFKYTVAASDDTKATKLYVKSVNMNGNKFVAAATGAEVTNISDYIASTDAIANGISQSLYKRRNILFDTTAPEISSISIVPLTGTYKDGDQVNFIVEFNEYIDIESASNMQLTLKNGIKQKAVVNSPSNGTKLDFIYTVKGSQDSNSANGDNATNLNAVSFTYSGTIKDAYGNLLSTTPTIPTNTSSVVIDTTPPAVPEIQNNIIDGKYYYDNITYTVDYKSEVNTTKYYFDSTTDKWEAYTTAVSLTTPETYKIKAKQIDSAKNESYSNGNVDYTIYLDKDPILEKISTGNTPNGVKMSGDITFTVKFRKPVYFTTIPTLKINAKTTPLTCSSASGLNYLQFTYTIANGDTCSALAIEALNAVLYDAIPTATNATKIYDNTAASYVDYLIRNTTAANIGTKLNEKLDNKNIEILTTGAPVITYDASGTAEASKTKTRIKETFDAGGNLTGRQLIITFDQKVEKKDGNIIIEQKNFRAPVVLTKTDYNKIPDAAKSYYKLGTIGLDSNNKPDITEKYILKYEYTPDTEALKTAFAGSEGFQKITIPVNSSKVVKTDDADKTTLTIDLEDSYALRVKGATYDVRISSGAVNNSKGQTNTNGILATDTAIITQTLQGVNAPVIRLDKGHTETVSGTTITQPDTLGFRIDCDTPGAKICYAVSNGTSENDAEIVLKTIYRKSKGGTVRVTNDGDTVTYNRDWNKYDLWDGGDNQMLGDYDVVGMVRNNKIIKSAPTYTFVEGTYTTNYVASVAITSNDDAALGKGKTVTNGLKCSISAKSFIGTSPSSASAIESSKEIAMKTVIVYDESTIPNRPDSNFNYRWIRGGDRTDGGNSLTNLPFSWKNSELDKIRLMKDTGTSNEYYWATWDLSSTTYVMFLAGNLNSSYSYKNKTIHTPTRWWWSSCGWSQDAEDCPVFAGECSRFVTSRKDSSGKYSGFTYMTEGNHKHNEYLDNGEIKSGYGN